jgi:hypothetical protein
LVAKHEETSEVYRRTIYAEVRRSMPLGMLEPFDPATLAPNCDRRNNSTVSTQSLLLMNNSNVIRLAEHFAQRIQREVGDEPLAQVRYAWTLAFGSPPDDLQCKTAANWLVAQRTALTKPHEVNNSTEAAEAKGTLEKPQAEQQALSLYCQAIFSSNPFLYVD